MLTSHTSFITQPNMYARGILFGKLKYELGDVAVVRCPETGLEAEVEFKVKGWVGGTYNAIGGNIRDRKSGKNLYELSGLWSDKMYIKDLSTGKKELLFDAAHSKPTLPKTRPLEEQSPRESQKLWNSTIQAIKRADQKTATDEKTRIEDEQRREAAERGDTAWKPKLFVPAPPGDEENLDWVINAHVDPSAPAERQIEQILAIAPILPGQKPAKVEGSEEEEKGEKGYGETATRREKEELYSSQGHLGGIPQSDGLRDEAAVQAAGQLAQQQSQLSHSSSSSALQNPSIDALATAVADASLSHTPPTSEPEALPPTHAAPSSRKEVDDAGLKSFGHPLRRVDSSGDEDTFHDAES